MEKLIKTPFHKAAPDALPDQYTEYALNKDTLGYAELRNNCWNYTIISRAPALSTLQKEYMAGFVQGKLQGELQLKASRNNTWNNFHLCDVSEPDKRFPRNFDPSQEELDRAARCMKENFTYTYHWIEKHEGQREATLLQRVFMRLWGVFDSTRKAAPSTEADFSELNPERLTASTGYGLDALTFYDLYLINTAFDVFDTLGNTDAFKESQRDHCSAFVKRTEDGNILFTHNTWLGFLSQTHTMNVVVGEDFVSENCGCQGELASLTDYGFNGHGILFNETTHRYGLCEPKTKGLWTSWRATLAELYAESVEDFSHLLQLDNTGTFLNGYAVADADTGEMGLLEMSYKRFVWYYSKAKGHLEVTDTLKGALSSEDYDTGLITSEHIFGVNYPASYDIAKDLQSTDNRPLRKVQFNALIDEVETLSDARDLITYTAPDEPLSLFGRWDLGYGTTPLLKTIPDGAIDAKVYSAEKVRHLLQNLKFKPNPDGGKTSFWMVFGTPYIKGKPFRWSESQWADLKKGQAIDLVPDTLDGAWDKVRLFMD